jgi:hypothetical protein
VPKVKVRGEAGGIAQSSSERNECQQILLSQQVERPIVQSAANVVAEHRQEEEAPVSYESHAEPIKLGYLFDFLLPDGCLTGTPKKSGSF